MRIKIKFVCYNSNNNSLIIVGNYRKLEYKSIVSLEIESIKAGLTTETNICPQDDGEILSWDFDIPNCRGMIYTTKNKLFKIFELKNYAQLFTIPIEGDDSFCSSFRFGSPGNMELLVMMYSENVAREEVLLRIYSKHTGQLRKRISIPVYSRHTIVFVELCGTGSILLQQSQLGMQILDISAEIPQIIKTTDIQMVGRPYYLYKRNWFICASEIGGMRRLNVLNLQGEILVTFQDHRICVPNLLGSDITSSQDIVISVCMDQENRPSPLRPDSLSINISSILTGKCIAKITTSTANCSDLRRMALGSLVPGSLVYDETTHEIFTAGQIGKIYIWSNKLCNDVQNNSSYIPINLEIR
jgi:hypothetical protein